MFIQISKNKPKLLSYLYLSVDSTLFSRVSVYNNRTVIKTYT